MTTSIRLYYDGTYVWATGGMRSMSRFERAILGLIIVAVVVFIAGGLYGMNF